MTHYFTKPYAKANFEYKRKRITLTLNLPISLNLAKINSQSSENQSLERLFFNPSLSFKLKAGDFWTYRVSGKFEQSSEIYDYQEDTFLYMDVSYQYSLRKHKLDFEVKLSNIFNNDAYISYYTGIFSLMESVYKLRPREVLCSMKFRF